ncbi:MAG: DNA polymerase III subunit delta [Deltaproteobacteria bacterium RBG_16_54_18]|nr:MAG: DNA polymerase III subunit delta [Deltaproteobacteria bacterium RBG_16_54_18]
MAARRIVLLKNAEGYGQAELKAFVQYLNAPSPTTSLILIADAVPAGFVKEVKEGAFPCSHPHPKEMAGWIRQMAQELGKEISPQAAASVQETVGTDLQGLYHELAKAVLYIGERRRIEVQDVEAVGSAVRVSNIFALTKAIGERNTKQAFRSLALLWESGEPPLKILGMMARQFRHLLMTKEAMAKGGGTEALKEQLPTINAYFLRELTAQARGFSRRSLQQAIVALQETDLKLKGSPLAKRLLLEGLIIKLARAA